jgi:ADP-heptose:LPS heptosyltransferase
VRASRIGDFINGTPAFRALRRGLPEAQITLITLPMLFELAERLAIFERILPFPGYPGLAEQFFDARRALDFFHAMQAEQFDLAIQMQGSGVYSNPFTLMLGARYTAGFVRPGDPPGRLDAALPFPEGHEARRNLALVRFIGVTGPEARPRAEEELDLRPEFPLWPEDHAAARQCLSGALRPWIGIHTSARDQTRRWPIQRFAQAAAQLQQRHGGTVILIGEERDRDEMEAALRPTGAPFRNLAGRTRLPVTGAVIHSLDVFLTNDTGPAHIAYATGAPTVTIFGGGDPLRNGPAAPGPFRTLAYPVPCRPCETGTCPIGLLCLEQITVEQVVAAAEELMAPGNQSRG